MNSRAYNWRGREITHLFWFLTANVGSARCYRCDAPAAGFDSNQRPLCYGAMKMASGRIRRQLGVGRRPTPSSKAAAGRYGLIKP